RLLAAADADLSAALRDRLTQQREVEERRLQPLHRGTLSPGVALTLPETGTAPQPPAFRLLRAYAFDPTLATRLETVPITQVTIPTRWEPALQPGPVGEYLEVVDVDPASGCVYSPV